MPAHPVFWPTACLPGANRLGFSKPIANIQMVDEVTRWIPDYADWTEEQVDSLTAHLAEFVTAEKLARMEEVLVQRTDHIRVVIEDVYQPHNGSAVVRSCECFGLQHLHIIEERYPYQVNPDVTMGSSKWMYLHRYDNPDGGNVKTCLQELRSAGFRIVGTALREETVPLADVPVDQPLALCFGTEEDGLTEGFLEGTDLCAKIPMFGFTQSFNLSVSAAISLYELTRRIRRDVPNWQLTPTEQREVRLAWILQTLRNPEMHIRRFRSGG